jgi:hypothetical protein
MVLVGSLTGAPWCGHHRWCNVAMGILVRSLLRRFGDRDIKDHGIFVKLHYRGDRNDPLPGLPPEPGFFLRLLKEKNELNP